MKKEELNTETAQQAPPIKKRLLSLDALRGITVAGMILVNNAGGKVSYAPLQHSAWNGLTLCDLVFPFFLFIMGISTYISLNKFNFNVSLQVVTKILKRTFLILCIGWAIGWFYKPQNKMFHFCKTFCSKITLVNTIQNVILNPI